MCMRICYLNHHEAVLCCYILILKGKLLRPFVTYLLILPRNFCVMMEGGCLTMLSLSSLHSFLSWDGCEWCGRQRSWPNRGNIPVLMCRDWNKHLQTSINIVSVSVEIRTKHLGNISVERYRYINLFGGARSTEQKLLPLHPNIHWSLRGPLCGDLSNQICSTTWRNISTLVATSCAAGWRRKERAIRVPWRLHNEEQGQRQGQRAQELNHEIKTGTPGAFQSINRGQDNSERKF
jgi:hypothetical protein